MPSQLVDAEDILLKLLTKIQLQVKEQRLIFLDLEGVNLSRHGTVALVQLLMPPDPTVYLIDIHILGQRAFTIHSEDPFIPSLQSALEAPDVAKVFFDVRHDCDALFSHYGVRLRGVVDLQLLEFATRRPRGRFVSGLSKCMAYEKTKLPPYTAGCDTKKEAGYRLFSPDHGGSYEVFLQRPLAKAIIDYCEQDVLVMPGLLALFARRLQPHDSAQLQGLVDARIELAQSPSYMGKGRHNAIGPQLHPRRDAQNSNLSFPMNVICSSRINDLCHVEVPSKLSTAKDKISPDKSQNSKHGPGSVAGNNTSEGTSTGTGRPVSSNTSFDLSSLKDVLSSRTDGGSDDDYEYHVFPPSHHYGYRSYDYDYDDDFKDHTACDKECGYCGRCSY